MGPSWLGGHKELRSLQDSAKPGYLTLTPGSTKAFARKTAALLEEVRCAGGADVSQVFPGGLGRERRCVCGGRGGAS